MKKLKNKVLLSLLVLAPFILSGCGDEQTEEVATNADGDIIMTVGQQTAPNSKLPEGDSFSDNAYRRLMKEKLGIELESAFEANGEDYDRQVSLAIASGDIPDMMVVSREDLQELVDNDLVADLTEVYEEFASDQIKEIYDSYDGITLDAATIDGQLMAIPGTTNDFGPNMVWIRQDWVDELGIKLDEDGNHAITLDELESTAKAFQEGDPEGNGRTQGLAIANWLTSGDHGGSAYTATAITNSFGAYPKVYLQDDNKDVYYGSNTEEMKESLTYLNKLFEEGILDSQFGTRTYDDIHAMMVNGELGIVPGPWHMSDWGLVQAKTANPDAEFIPYAIENENGDGNINAVNKSATGGFVVIRKGFENPEALIEMLNVIFDDVANSKDMENEYPELYEYAKLAVDGAVKPLNIELFFNESEIHDAKEATQAAKEEINIEEISKFVIQNNARKIKAYLDNPSGAEPSDWAVYASRTLAVNDVMGGTRETNILNEIKPIVIFQTLDSQQRSGAQVGKLEEEMFIKFVTGEEPLDNFDKYVSDWNSQGGTVILDEMQAVVDERE